ncbi:hypothetical protein AB1N83_008875 [Pleurotus pulmonarius]
MVMNLDTGHRNLCSTSAESTEKSVHSIDNDEIRVKCTSQCNFGDILGDPWRFGHSKMLVWGEGNPLSSTFRRASKRITEGTAIPWTELRKK